MTAFQLDTKIINNSINNLSRRILTYEEQVVLGLGLKFLPTPNNNHTILLDEFEQFIRLIKINLHFERNRQQLIEPFIQKFKIPSKWEPKSNPKALTDLLERKRNSLAMSLRNISRRKKTNRNLTNRQRLIFTNLITDKDIRICNADKNMGITIVDNDWYNLEICTQLSNTEFYTKQIPNCIKIKKQLLEIVQKYEQTLTRQERKFLIHRVQTFKSPRFYILPKIHKNPIKGRPIIPSHKWITSGASIWLDHHLDSILAFCPNVIKDSRTLIHILETNSFHKECILITADVNSLYTNIDIDKGIRKVTTFIKKHINNTNLQYCMIECLNLVLRNNYFLFNFEWYHQRKGTAMGTQMAPKYANIYMQFLENILFNKRINTGKNLPALYKRYLDDILIIWKGDETNLQEFLNELNDMDADIKLTWSIDNNITEFLDLIIYKGARFQSTGIFDLRIHRKKLNPYLYIPYTSAIL